MFAFPALMLLASFMFVAISPLVPMYLVGSYWPEVLFAGSVESKLSVEMLFPFISISCLAASALMKGLPRAHRTTTARMIEYEEEGALISAKKALDGLQANVGGLSCAIAVR